ncbi:MAG: NUDIX domain-containing protein [Prevotella sp.]|nr:NUDIX domain-containing protein [Prevotella sp.]
MKKREEEHPLEVFRYCPRCGSAHFTTNNEKSKRCSDCGFTYYANPSSATAAFIRDERGRLLVARRGKEPAKGTLDLVGGFVDMNESGEEGLRREIEEETGLRVENSKYLFSIPNRYLYSGMVIHTLDMFYEVNIGAEAEPVAGDDAAELMWKETDELKAEEFGLESIRKAVERYLGWERCQQRVL